MTSTNDPPALPVITVTDLKGGTGKTTTAMYLLAGLHREYGNALGIDGDDQGSLMSWADRSSPDFMVMAMPSKTIHRHIEDLIANYAHVVIDTPPAGRAVVMSAMQAAAQHSGQILIPLQPTTHDLDQLGETLAVVEDATGTAEVAVSILLTRAVKGTRALRQVRDALDAAGHDVLDTVIHQSQTLALAHGSAIGELGEYRDVLIELREKATR